jgi:hypothetical protein
MRLLAATLIALSLAACATPTPYAPGATPGGPGFSERRIEENRYAITFRGNSLTPRETVEDYLLYRAAELTLAQGLDHFSVASRATDAKTRLQSNGGRSAFWYDYWLYSPRYGYRSFYGPFGDPFFDHPEYREVTRFEATAEIAMFKGPKPENNAQAYDARDVAANLAGKIQRPAPKS